MQLDRLLVEECVMKVEPAAKRSMWARLRQLT